MDSRTIYSSRCTPTAGLTAGLCKKRWHAFQINRSMFGKLGQGEDFADTLAARKGSNFDVIYDL